MSPPDTDRPELRMPVLMATPCGQFLSVITWSAKCPGLVQRTLFTRGKGPSTDDQHWSVAQAVVQAKALGFTVVIGEDRLAEFMPQR